MTVDFKALLQKPVDSVKAPEPLPEGHYNGRIAKYEFGESQQKKTPYVRFALSLDSAREDVDQAALADMDLSKKQLRKDYYLTEDALFRLRGLLEACNVSIEGRSFDVAIPELIGTMVNVEVIRKPSTDGESFFNEVKDITAA